MKNNEAVEDRRSLPRAINDLARADAPIATELHAAARRVIDSGWYVLGPELTAFESEFALYCGARECVGVANGTDAIELALRALGAGPGTTVATVGNAGMYATCAILAVGAQPLFIDVDEESMTMSAAALRRADLSKCAAIVVTHLFGQLADVESLVEIAASAGIPLVEDCAQSHGASRGGRKAGTFGNVGCFSFYPTKNLGALGDGGAVVTSDARLAAEVRSLRQYGWSSKYVASRPGGRNSRLDEMQAAFLRAKLPHLDAWNRRRREVANRYLARLRNPRVRLPAKMDESHVGHLYVVRTPRRDALAAHLKALSVPVDVHYPIPDYRQPALAGACGVVHAPTTDAACASVLTLPCFPMLTDAEVDSISDAVNAWAPAS